MKYLKNIIGIAVVIVLALGIINFHKIKELSFLKNKANIWQESAKQKLGIYKHNLSFTFAPERKRPLSFLSREAKLVHLAKNVFGQFDPSEWDNFWNLIYDPIEEEQGQEMVKRYRTQGEIEHYLRYNNANPFSYFKKEHWSYFWNIVFGAEE
ncbi:MAG: hypothetical protein P9M02_00615 [Candidatus Susulua stagnicola]|nr:hypothetical protein [Candidatus Susulua stagnicola]